jgi:hypothetical protein
MKTRTPNVNTEEQTNQKHTHLNYCKITLFVWTQLSWSAQIKHIYVHFKLCVFLIPKIYLSYSLKQCRKAWRYQSCNQYPQIEGLTMQCPTEKEQRDKSMHSNTQKIKDRATLTSLKIGVELRCSGNQFRLHVWHPFANPVTCHEWGMHKMVMTTSGTFPWSFLI